MLLFFFVRQLHNYEAFMYSLITQSQIAAVVLNSVAVADSFILPTAARCFMRLRHFHVLAIKPSAWLSGCKLMVFGSECGSHS